MCSAGVSVSSIMLCQHKQPARNIRPLPTSSKVAKKPPANAGTHEGAYPLADRKQPQNMSVLEHNTYKFKGSSPDIRVHLRPHIHTLTTHTTVYKHTHTHMHTLVRKKFSAQHSANQQVQSASGALSGVVLNRFSCGRQQQTRL
jgi:hypothetical protein